MKSPIVQSAVHKAQQAIGVEFAIEVQKHAEIYEQLLHQFASAVAAGHTSKARKAQHLILHSFSAKLVCLVHCLDKDSGLSAEAVRDMAAGLDPYNDCGEKITCWAEPKASGEGWRPICSFGPKRQAIHWLIVDILKARFGVDDSNYLTKGKGAERACDRIVYLVEQEQFPIFVLADIENFFRSVQHGSVSKATGLPEEVVKNGILINSAAALIPVGGFPPNSSLCVSTSPIKLLVGAAQQGLPQGSRASEVVAAILLGPALRQVASAECVVFHGDDFALAATNMKEATALKKAAIGTLESHPAGPFRLKRCEIKHIKDGFNFLQYHHRLDPFSKKVRRRPADQSYIRYERRVVGLFATFGFKEAFKLTVRYRWRWIRSFRCWNWVQLSKGLLWQTTFAAMKEGQQIKSKNAVKNSA